MDKFIEYLKTKTKIADLDKFIKNESTEYISAENKIVVKMIYNEKYSEIYNNNKGIIEDSIIEYIGSEFKSEIIFKKSYLDSDYLKILIKKELLNYSSAVTSIITEDSIKVTQQDDTFIITFDLEIKENFKDAYNNMFVKIIDKIKDSYFYGFKVNINVIEKKDTISKKNYISEESITQELEMYRNTNLYGKDKFIKVDNLRVFVGKEMTSEPIDLSELIKNKTRPEVITICGKCYNFQKKSYKKQRKDKKTGEIMNIESYRYSFIVTYNNETVYCSYFPRMKEIYNELTLEDGADICVKGVPDEYMGNITIKVSDISICDILGMKEVEKKILPIPEKYYKVYPEEFYVAEQLDMFAYIDNKLERPEITDVDYVVFDLETTGLSSESDSIIEISAIKIHDGRMIQSFNTFVNPEKAIPDEVKKLTNIEDEMVKDAPKGYEIIGDFLLFCKDCTMVAYNAPFDMGFIRKLASECNYEVTNPVEDALMLAREKLNSVKNYKLVTVAEKLNVSLEGAHRAINDTLATAKVFLKLLKMD